MASLYWEIHWEYGVFPLDTEVKKACQQIIQEHLLKAEKVFGPDDLGYTIEGLVVRVQNSNAFFSARLCRVEPSEAIRVDRWTNIYARPASGDIRKGTVSMGSTASDEELDSFVLWKTVFDPKRPDPYYATLYDSLVGIDKEVILEEMTSLLAPVDNLRDWSMKYYNRIPPILRTVASKVPLIVFGGDPGTGKTALATSVGSTLSQKIQERVHFRHMSLSMRGMGYQGRASSLIVKSFERINEEYLQLREPMIVFFDEAEAIVGSREQSDVSSGSQQDIAIVDAIIVGVDSLRKGTHSRVVVIFATNIVGRIDAALMRRCFYHEFKRPDDEARRKLIEASLQGLGFNDRDLDELVMATRPKNVDGQLVSFTHSDIVELIIVRAINMAVRLNQPVTLPLLLTYCEKAIPTRSLSNFKKTS